MSDVRKEMQMIDSIHCNDGCDLSPEEVLARLQIGLKSDEELHPDYPCSDMLYSDEFAAGDKSADLESRASLFAPSVTDRGLSLLALPSKGEGISDEKEAVELPSNRTD